MVLEKGLVFPTIALSRGLRVNLIRADGELRCGAGMPPLLRSARLTSHGRQTG